MLTQDFKQSLQTPNSPLSGGVPLNQPIDSDSFRQWAEAKPADTSPYKTAMGLNNTEKGIIPQTVDTFKEGFSQTAEGAKNPDLFQGLQQIGRGTLNEMGAGLRAAFSPVEAGLKLVSQLPGFHQALGALQDHVINPTANAISDNKHIQDFMKSNPHADEVFGNLVNIVGAIVGGKMGAKETITDAAGNLGDKISETASNISDKLPPPPGGGASKITTVDPMALEKNAIADSTPAYNKKLIGEPAIKNADGTSTPRVSEVDSKNPLKMRTVNSTPSEIEAGKELAKIDGYDPKATALDKYNKVSETIAKKSEAYRTSLQNEKVLIPKKEMTALVKRTVNETSQNSLLLQKTDPIVKNYIRVAQRAAEKVDGTLAGEDQLRLSLDQAYEDAGGKYGNNKGLDQIHRAARNAITKDMEARAQTTQVKASLKEMENLYNANDILQDKAAAEGGSKWEQFKKAHPTLTKVGGRILKTAGLGEAVHLAP